MYPRTQGTTLSLKRQHHSLGRLDSFAYYVILLMVNFHSAALTTRTGGGRLASTAAAVDNDEDDATPGKIRVLVLVGEDSIPGFLASVSLASAA